MVSALTLIVLSSILWAGYKRLGALAAFVPDTLHTSDAARNRVLLMGVRALNMPPSITQARELEVFLGKVKEMGESQLAASNAIKRIK